MSPNQCDLGGMQPVTHLRNLVFLDFLGKFFATDVIKSDVNVLGFPSQEFVADPTSSTPESCLEAVVFPCSQQRIKHLPLHIIQCYFCLQRASRQHCHYRPCSGRRKVQERQATPSSSSCPLWESQTQPARKLYVVV